MEVTRSPLYIVPMVQGAKIKNEPSLGEFIVGWVSNGYLLHELQSHATAPMERR